MKRHLIVLGAAVVLCAAFAVPTQDSRPSDAKRIDTLSRALDLEKKKTAELQARVERIENWFAMVRSASDMLDSAVNEARRNGFESAGPNPLARTQLLDGMKSFAVELARGAPGPLPVPPAEPK
jgi:hypothetical protein